MSVRRSAAPPHLTGASCGAPGTLRGPAITLNRQSSQTVPTDGWRFFGEKHVPKPTPVEVPQPRTFAPRVEASFQQEFKNGRRKFEIAFTQGDRSLLHAEVTIEHNIHSVFYPEVLRDAEVTTGPLSPQAVREIRKFAQLFMQAKYAELDSIIERDFPENKNQARPEVKKLQDKVEDAASLNDFYRAIELALTRIPDAIYEKTADGKDYLRRENGKLRAPTRTFVKTWVVDAANVALMEAVLRAIA